MLSILGWIVTGWIAGSIAEWVIPPASQSQGWQTIGTGVAGSVVGGLVYGMVHGSGYSPAGIVWSIVGAILCLGAWRWWQSQEVAK
jgi:uncharacterized membrane protein YeaQ/YmgE (transglycosylase-associated protein family)